jgi:hypothetical protein
MGAMPGGSGSRLTTSENTEKALSLLLVLLIMKIRKEAGGKRSANQIVASDSRRHQFPVGDRQRRELALNSISDYETRWPVEASTISVSLQ